MKKLLGVAALVAALGSAGEAQAQFANRSLGLTVGILSLDNVSADLSFGVPVGLSGSLYIENGFDLVANVGLMVVHERISGQNVVALDGPSLGLRYLFLEESLRPYLGIDLSYLHIFGLGNQSASVDYFGVGPNLGVEYFVSDSVSIGARVRYILYLTLNNTWSAYGANLGVSTYF